MELWIRSQDKMTLANVYSLYAIERDFAKNDSIWWEIYCNDEISLGLYLKDRAEEILDDIQKKINLINLGHDFGSPMIDLENPTYIYEMPID